LNLWSHMTISDSKRPNLTDSDYLFLWFFFGFFLNKNKSNFFYKYKVVNITNACEYTPPPFFRGLSRTWQECPWLPMAWFDLIKLEGTFWKGIRIIPKFPLVSWKTAWIPFIGNSGEFCLFPKILKNVSFSHAKSWVS